MKVYEKDGDISISIESATVSPDAIKPQSATLAPVPENDGSISPLAKPKSQNQNHRPWRRSDTFNRKTTGSIDRPSSRAKLQ